PSPSPTLFPCTTLFRSLAEMIQLALQESPDLAMAVERVRQAEAQVRIAGASLFPQLDVGVSTNRRRTDPDDRSAVTTEGTTATRSEEHTSELQSRENLV